MLYGTSIYLMGLNLLVIGDKIGLTALVIVGEAVRNIGIKLFVTGAVPIYGLFYALPKHIILSLPKIANFVIAKTSVIATWIFQTLIKPVWVKLLAPVVQTLGKALGFVATKVEIALNAVIKVVANLTKLLFKHVINPLWNKVLYPILQKAVHIVSKVAYWVFQHLLTPLWNKVLFPALKVTAHVIYVIAKAAVHTIQTLASATAKAASFIFQETFLQV